MTKKYITKAQAANRLTRRGMRVLRVYGVQNGRCTCRKAAACKSPGKHPVDASCPKTASPDSTTVSRWFARNPDLNIGIATGAGSKLLVLDIDPRHGGQETLARAQKRFGPLPPTVTVRTGGGGQHLYFRYPAVAIKSDHAGKLVGSGVDVQSDGAFVVAPGSYHSSGRSYRWAEGRGPAKQEMAVLPDTWVQLLAGGRRFGADTEPARPVDDPAALIPEGRRNEELCSLAGRLHRAGLPAVEIQSLVESANVVRCRPPLGRYEVAAIVRSVSRYPTVGANPPAGDPAEHTMQLVVARHFADGEHILYGRDGRFWHYDGRR